MEQKILIIRLSAIGDVLHCTPVARTLKTVWPDCRITWLTGEVAATLLYTNPYIDEVIVWSRENFEKSFYASEYGKAWRMWRVLRRVLSNKTFDVILDVHGLFITGLMANMPKVKRRIGLKGAKELNSWFMTETAAAASPHIVDRYLGVLQALEIAQTDSRMTLVVPDELVRSLRERLQALGLAAGKRYIVLLPGTTWLAKIWPPGFFAKAAEWLSKDFHIVLCGGDQDIPRGEELENTTGVPLINQIGQTSLMEMAAILKQAAVVIGSDTGPLHMAAALDVPTVAIFGPTDPAVYAPTGEKHTALFVRQPCSFCHKMVCPQGYPLCTKAVTPRQVVQAAYRAAQVK